MVFWAPGRAAHSWRAFIVGNETSVSRANGDFPAGDPRMRCEARPVAPTNVALPIGRCSRSYRRSNCSGSVGVGYSTRSLTLMASSSLDVSGVPYVSIGLDGPGDYRGSSGAESPGGGNGAGTTDSDDGRAAVTSDRYAPRREAGSAVRGRLWLVTRPTSG